MPFNPLIHNRRSIRLRGYDYTQPGAYFITIVTIKREQLFGAISAGEMRLNECGEIVADCWSAIPDHYCDVVMDEFAIMPNHIHGIIVICENVVEPAHPVGMGFVPIFNMDIGMDVGAGSPRPYETKPPHPIYMENAPTLGQIVAFFKYQSTKCMNKNRRTPGAPIWQCNYYACPERQRGKHIIRNEVEWTDIREYIQNNPFQWEMDEDNLSSRQRINRSGMSAAEPRLRGKTQLRGVNSRLRNYGTM
jgi:putative transposase